MGFNATTRTIDNNEDVRRKVQTEQAEQSFLTESEGQIQERVAGVASGQIALGRKISSVTTVLAFVAASGAPAAKCLLDEATDYDIVAGNLNILVDQSANNLVVAYKPDSSEGENA